MKGFTRDNKFVPMTDYKKVTRKSRDQKATKGVRLSRNKKFKSQLTPEARERFVSEVQDQISDDVNTEFQSNPESYGFTKKDVKNPTDKYNMAIVKEIDRRIEEQIKEQTEIKPMGSFEDAFTTAFNNAQTRKARDTARKVKNKHGTFVWNPRSLRVSQVVKIKDLTGRHGNEIGTSRVAITEAESSQNFKDVANNPPVINGKVIGVVRKGEILNKRFEVVAI